MMTTRKKALEGKRKRKGPSILKNYVLTGMSRTARQTPSPPSSSKTSRGDKNTPTKKKDAANPTASDTNGKKTLSSNRRRKQMLKKDEKAAPSSATKASESVLNFSDSTLKETLLAAVAANFNCEEFKAPLKTADASEDPLDSTTDEMQGACETEDPIVEDDKEKVESEESNIAESVPVEKKEENMTVVETQPKISLVPVKADVNKDHMYKIILSPKQAARQETTEKAVLNLESTIIRGGVLNKSRSLIKPNICNQQSSFKISRINNDMIITQKQSSGSSQKIIINSADSKAKGQLIPIKVVKTVVEKSCAPTVVPIVSPPHTQVATTVNPPLFYIQSPQSTSSEVDLTALVQRNLPSILASLQKQQKVMMNRDMSSVQCPDLVSIAPQPPTSTAKELSAANMLQTSICQPLYINTRRTESLTVTPSTKLITTPAVQLARNIKTVFNADTARISQIESTLSCEETMSSISDMTEPTPSPTNPESVECVATPKEEEQLGINPTAVVANNPTARPVMLNSSSLPSNSAYCFFTQTHPTAQPIGAQPVGASVEKNSTKKKRASQHLIKPKSDTNELMKTIQMLKMEIGRLKKKNEKLEDLNGALQTKLKILYQFPLNQQRQEELLLRILDQMPTLVTAAVSGPGLDSTVENMMLPPVSTLINNEVHLGQGVWLAKPEYDKVMQSALTPSLLVRNLAVAIYGEDVLKASTVVGKYNTKISEKGARPPLSPTRCLAIRETFDYWLTRHGFSGQHKVDELSHTTHYLGSKIQDLRSDPSRSRPAKRGGKTPSSEDSSQEGPSGLQKPVSESSSKPPKKAAKRKPSLGGDPSQPSKKTMLHNLPVSSGDDSSEMEAPCSEKASETNSSQCQKNDATPVNKKKPARKQTEPGKTAQARKKPSALDIAPDVEEQLEDWQNVCEEVARIKQELKSDSDGEGEVNIETGTVQSLPDAKMKAFFDSITKQIESEDS